MINPRIIRESRGGTKKVKEYYQIHELAKLFDLCPDTLRYYEEKGLLHPARGENRYRRYGIQDVCTLNIIRALRELDLPTRTIRDYLERRSVGETMALLDREEELLDRRMAELEEAKREAAERRQRLERYRAVEALRPEWVVEEARPYVFLEEDFILEKEIDFQLKRLAQRHQDYIQIIGSQCMGAALDQDSLERGVYNHFSRVFFLTRPGLPCDDRLPAGEYARLYYRGPYEALEDHLTLLTGFVTAEGRRPAGPPLELYRIDAHDTNRVEEYVTELQIRVEG
nr:MerR family transcriptional regulator [Pseudoflavonifractor phocaeensis]